MEKEIKRKQSELFLKLLEIMDDLRENCPWDRQQTFDSLRNLTIEEAYELIESIIEKDYEGIEEELGDLLLHIVFYAKLGSEINKFDIISVIDKLCKKLIYRHPHVFGNVDVNNNPENVKKNWEELKNKEGKRSILEGLPANLPSINKAMRIQEKVRAVGFDWEKPSDVWNKVEEELKELKYELTNNKQNKEKIEEEFGDLLFAVINAARLHNIDPDLALEKTNKKFIKRFQYIEEKASVMGKNIHSMTLEEMNNLWEESKKMTFK